MSSALSLEWMDVFATVVRWAVGLGIGTCLAVFTVALLLTSQRATTVGWLLSGFFKALPILALQPLFMNVFGISEYTKYMLIAWAGYFPLVVTLLIAARSNEPDLMRRLDLAKISVIDRYRKYTIPKLIPAFIAGFEISMGLCWLTIVTAEFAMTRRYGFWQFGLGDYVYQNFDAARYMAGFIGMGLFGLLGFSSAYAWRAVSSKWGPKGNA